MKTLMKIILGLIVILGIGYGAWSYNYSSKVSHQFRGVVSEFKSDSMVLEGNYVLSGDVSVISYGPKVVTAFIDTNTEYVRREVPSNGLVVGESTSTVSDILTKVSKEDFERDVTASNLIVSVNSADNIRNQDSFRIISAEYTVIGQR